MKTDSIFYRLFQTLPSIFFELINQSNQSANNYQFDSVEIKQLAFRIDGVFLPKDSQSDEPIYFVEVQFQPDNQFYSRFFAEIFLYLKQTERNNDWQALVIYPSRLIESTTTRRYQELLNTSRVTRIYLDELPTNNSLGIETIKLIIAELDKTAAMAKSLITQVREEITDDRVIKNLIELIETIVIYKFPEKSYQEIETMLGLGDIKQTKVYQEGKEEGIKEGELKGKQEGKLEGIKEGELKGKLESIPSLLKLGLTVEQIANALNLDIAKVREIASKSN